MATEPKVLLSGTVNGSGTYKSPVFQQGDNRAFVQASYFSTNGGTGILESWMNHMPPADYEAAVAAASGSTRAEKEANNVTGWFRDSFRHTDVIPAVGTDGSVGISAPVNTGSGTVFLTNTTTVTTVNQVGLSMPPGPYRRRIHFVGTANAGSLTVYQNLFKIK